ncbi:MAG: 5-methyltetrahydropteroyltriglutamate--homocysteine S-methyltransferase [Proteobacteria bacterium]|nr:5-methyltetrahydropteroyltriglutamate--homocysteine S-methyltransferase [Pseudomonadota bacterium]
MEHHILGFPRIGAKRELKLALERFWRDEITQNDLERVGNDLKERHWELQRKAGLSFVAVGDFSFYDQMLDTALMLGAVPARFAGGGQATLETCFRMARGDAARNLPAMEMTKWFNTNYHYIVPELSAAQGISLSTRTIIEDTLRAVQRGYRPKPVLVGPITFLALAKGVDGFDCWQKLDDVVAVYAELLAELGQHCQWIQMDEPVLCSDLGAKSRSAFSQAYGILNKAAGSAKLLLATYFDTLDDNLDLALTSGCAGLHLDLVRGGGQLEAVLAKLPQDMVLSAGVVDGRNVWKTDCAQALVLLDRIRDKVGDEGLMVGSSCSLLHSPVDLENETTLDSELKNWMAFATQKCDEIHLLGQALCGADCAEALAVNARAIVSRRNSPRVNNKAVARRCAAVDQAMLSRNSEYSTRAKAQSWLDLPLFPTTTIGSYPQTAEIRRQRRLFNEGESSPREYEAFMQQEIRQVVSRQEELGLDVLVHGEAERNDMVEYFGQQMDGFCFTANGWVQSYGSRCVKPPIIYGDVSRPQAMTVKWITYAQSLTKKPMKGMLTGPCTILCWSFVRDDMERSEVCRQIALGIRDEVQDLEAAGVRIIQIDEAAFSEGMPIKQKDRGSYLQWAVDCFRLSTSGARDSTQIHSHMCYSEFNEIISSIAAMDADVISIESSRSGMELLDAFKAFSYPNEIGPGVYDIHSPRVPTAEEMIDLLQRASGFIPMERLWVNPDCGLKTRNWPETLASLKNMVEAAHRLRALVKE